MQNLYLYGGYYWEEIINEELEQFFFIKLVKIFTYKIGKAIH